MISISAAYSATNWANGKTLDEIQIEINRINKIWEMGRDFQFAGNAYYQYFRMITLEQIMLEQINKTKTPCQGS